MLPYWVLFSLCSAGAIGLRRQNSYGSESRGLLLAALVAFVLIAFRFRVGDDWFNYIEIFNYWAFIRIGRLFEFADPAYSVLNWAAHEAGIGIWAVNAFCAAIVVWGLTRFARSQPDPWLVYVVAVPYFLIVVAMGYTRQGVAIGLILGGMTELRHGKLVRFILCIALASTFHRSAIVVLPIVLLAFATKRVFVVAAIAAVLAVAYDRIFSASFSQLMNVYVVQTFDSQGALVRVLMNVVPAVLFLAAPRRFSTTDFEVRLWASFSFASLLCLAVLLVSTSTTAVDRVGLYLIPLQLFVLPRLPLAFPGSDGGENRLLLTFVIVYSAMIQLVWLNFAAHADSWVPYQFYPFGSETASMKD